MGLIVNHNMMAMNAARNLSTAYARLSISTQRLSSGLRVNTAADDAAGMAVRASQRADIAVLNQGIRNAGDAISMIQTAEGALSVIDEKLIRMKELAEQAATGTYSTDQRQIMEDEYNEMAKEITRIATATDFNGTSLLDGSLSADSTDSTAGMKIHFGTGNDAAQDYYYITIEDMTSEKLGAAVSVYSSQVSVASQGSVASQASAASQDSVAGQVSIASQGAVVVQASIGSRAAVSGGSYGSIASQAAVAEQTSVGSQASVAVTATQASVASQGSVASQAAVGTMASMASQTGVDSIAAITVSQASVASQGSVASQAAITAQTSIGSQASVASQASIGEMASRGASATGASVGSQGAIAAADTQASIAAQAALTASIASQTSVASQAAVDSQASTQAWSAGVLLRTQEGAQQALGKVDTAMGVKNVARAKLGAMQNRLENTITNLTIQAENTQAAESRISDVDIATEMTEFTRNSILAQAATAMLSQANSLPKLALQLLGG